jgi:hypothetical protein
MSYLGELLSEDVSPEDQEAYDLLISGEGFEEEEVAREVPVVQSSLYFIRNLLPKLTSRQTWHMVTDEHNIQLPERFEIWPLSCSCRNERPCEHYHHLVSIRDGYKEFNGDTARQKFLKRHGVTPRTTRFFKLNDEYHTLRTIIYMLSRGNQARRCRHSPNTITELAEEFSTSRKANRVKETIMAENRVMIVQEFEYKLKLAGNNSLYYPTM